MKNIRVYGEVMEFKVGDKVKINPNYDRKKFKYFGPTADFYRNKVGVIEEAKTVNITKDRAVEVYVVKWDIGVKSKMVNDVLALVDEKYKSVW